MEGALVVLRWRGIKAFLSLILLVMVIGLSYFFKTNSIGVSGEKYEQPIYSVATDEKKVAITFDINWAEKDYLEGILDVLDKYNVKATFFIMGGWVNYSDENLIKLKLISDRGHEIGNHSYKHPNFSTISMERMEEEVEKTNKLLEEYTGEKPKLFRFPSGDYNKTALDKVRSLNMIPIQWSADSVDWKEQGEEVEFKRVIDKLKEGSIILFHNNAKYTVKNLDKLLTYLRENEYEAVTVGELIYKENYSIDEKGTQYRK